MRLVPKYLILRSKFGHMPPRPPPSHPLPVPSPHQLPLPFTSAEAALKCALDARSGRHVLARGRSTVVKVAGSKGREGRRLVDGK